MFKAFSERLDPKTRQRMLLSAAVSALLYGGLGTAVVVAAAGVSEAVAPAKGTEVDVTFFKALPPPPPTPKPAPVTAAAAAPAAPAPPAPKADPKTPPAKPLPKPPKRDNDKQLNEATPSPNAPDVTPGNIDNTNNGTGDGDATGSGSGGTGPANSTGTGTGPGAPDATGTGGGPVILPAGATPPERIGALVSADDYPRGALSARVEGTVIVKVIIQVDGSVDLVKFIKSDPTFDDAVKNILKRVKFKPAIYNGQPIAVYQNLRFPFTIDDE